MLNSESGMRFNKSLINIIDIFLSFTTFILVKEKIYNLNGKF